MAHRLVTKKKPRTANYVVHLDDELAEEVEQLRRKLGRAELKGENGAATLLREELDKKLEALKKQTVTIKLQSVGRKRYDEIVLEHPIPEELKEELGEDAPEWNPDTFPQALIRESIVEPDDLTDEDVDAMWETWNQSELTTLFSIAVMVNTQRRVVDLGN